MCAVVKFNNDVMANAFKINVKIVNLLYYQKKLRNFN